MYGKFLECRSDVQTGGEEKGKSVEIGAEEKGKSVEIGGEEKEKSVEITKKNLRTFKAQI